MQSVEQFADRILREAYELKASDIHLVPTREGAEIRMRVDQDLVTKYVIPKDFCERVISHFKFLAAMDIGERRKPQNGSLELQMNFGDMHLRMSTLPTIQNESLVIRIHLQTSVQPLSQLSLFPNSAKTLLSFLYHSHGLMIFTGPTGSVL